MEISYIALIFLFLNRCGAAGTNAPRHLEFSRRLGQSIKNHWIIFMPSNQTDLLANGPDCEKRGNTQYYVNGFRSLQNFNITLTTGLNVLLGVNGSGKTNFIDFLDFIADATSKNTAAAISAAGGIARVFGQETLRRKIPRITAKMTGLADMLPFLTMEKGRKTKFKFEYEVDIRFSKFHTAVYIAREKIKFKNLHSDEYPEECEGIVGSIEINRKNPLDSNSSILSIGPYLFKNTVRNPLRRIHAHRRPMRKAPPSAEADLRYEMLNQLGDVPSDESILSSRSGFPAIDAVRSALSRVRSFNLNPHRARMPTDISRPPVIEPDGSGLSATLYHMQQIKKVERSTYGVRYMPKDALETVISWTQVVMPGLTDITATADPHTGKYVAYLHVSAKDGVLKIPLQNASDGTLKWLAFVCLIASGGANYTFEEHENFMHPRMQQYFIDILRDASESGRDSRVIISTHSETLINQLDPSELILFDFSDGITKCKRVSNKESLIKQVNATGFGLGYYYRSNVVL